MQEPITFFWFRRDLRIHDNAGLCEALRSGHPVQCVFIFDRDILDDLEDRNDKRVDLIHRELDRLDEELREAGGRLLIRYGRPLEIWNQLISEWKVAEVYANRDYEPYALVRDRAIYELLKENGIPFKGFKDQVILEKKEVLKDDGQPYQVYSPYMRKWKETLSEGAFHPYPSRDLLGNLSRAEVAPGPTLQEMGFHPTDLTIPDRAIDREVISRYDKTRDFPGDPKGTTRLSVHLRFGTISIRELASVASELNEKYLNELIWREFYQMVLFHFPESCYQAIKPAYDTIEWVNDEGSFERWCLGKTGYPLVDAGMRELNSTGYMHNRSRMVVASFLTKHLLIDWRWGEAYFAKKLLDYDMASNIGGWQWAAGSGMDAAPYFRIFNPDSQAKKFDPEYTYVKKWVAEWGSPEYPSPMVDNKKARERALKVYKNAVSAD